MLIGFGAICAWIAMSALGAFCLASLRRIGSGDSQSGEPVGAEELGLPVCAEAYSLEPYSLAPLPMIEALR